MVVYAVFMCIAHLAPGQPPPRCILMSDKPHTQGAAAYEAGVMTTLAQCDKERLRFVGGEMPGWKVVCLKQTVPAWGPAS